MFKVSAHYIYIIIYLLYTFSPSFIFSTIVEIPYKNINLKNPCSECSFPFESSVCRHKLIKCLLLSINRRKTREFHGNNHKSLSPPSPPFSHHKYTHQKVTALLPLLKLLFVYLLNITTGEWKESFSTKIMRKINWFKEKKFSFSFWAFVWWQSKSWKKKLDDKKEE